MEAIEVERDEWLKDHTQACITHRIEENRHRVAVICQEYDDTLEKSAVGRGNSYLEALLVALRNWESEWGYMERR